MGKTTYLHNDGRECVPDRFTQVDGHWTIDIKGAEPGGNPGESCYRAHPDLSGIELTTVTDLRTCAPRIERAYRKLREHRLVPFANAAGGRCICEGFVIHVTGEEAEHAWAVHLAVAVARCAS